ncbi:MAG: hypothetical protein D6801_04695 [Alphaproteobacteria bacterium]|nr:MAG: hypothetical protein D6801_04695 [Alphaproteobacteria bacterium]
MQEALVMRLSPFPLLLAFGLSLAAPEAARADGAICGTRADMAYRLGAIEGEGRLAIGLAGDRLIELFVAPETGNWTILVTSPEGRSCLVATGEGLVWFGAVVPPGDPA